MKSGTFSRITSRGLIQRAWAFSTAVWLVSAAPQGAYLFLAGPSLAKGERNLSSADGTSLSLSDAGSMSIRKTDSDQS